MKISRATLNITAERERELQFGLRKKGADFPLML